MKKEALSPAGRSALARFGLGELEDMGACLLRFEKGETVCRQGQPLAHLLLVLEGRAKVCVAAANGSTVLFSFYGGSGVLGEVELLSSHRDATTTVQAVTPFLCVGLPLDRYESALLACPHFLAQAARSLAEKLRRCTNASTMNLLYTVEQRLCAYLIAAEGAEALSESLTELSQLLGASYRHLLRVFRALCAEGILEKRGRVYAVKDRAALANRAGECALL